MKPQTLASKDDIRAPSLHSILSKLTLFDGVDGAILQNIGAKSSMVHLSAGDTLFAQGDTADAIYSVISGRLLALRSSTDGPVVLGEIGRGEIVGEIALLSGAHRTATIVAARDSELLRIEERDFAELLESQHHVSAEMARLLVRRLTVTMDDRARLDRCARAFSLVPLTGGFDVRLLANKLAAGLEAHGSVAIVDRDDAIASLGKEIVECAPIGGMRRSGIETWLNRRELEADHVIYPVCHLDDGWGRACLGQSDRIVFAAYTEAREISGAETGKLRSIASHHQYSKPEIILIQSDDASHPRNTQQWIELGPFERWHHVRMSVNQDFARLARRLTGRAHGLVLGGGGAKGFAHIGVIRALEEAEIEIDEIGGTSMGAVIAALMARGMNSCGMVEHCRAMFRGSSPMNDYRLPLIGLLAGRKADRALQSAFGDTRLEDLWLSMFCVSTNLTRSRMEVDDRGAVWLALRASISIPGVFPPVVRSGDVLVDGGVIDNLPVDILHGRHIDKLIAVEVASNTGTAAPGWDKPTLNGWAVFVNRYLGIGRRRIPTILDVLWASATVGSDRAANQARENVDLLIRPQLSQFRTMDWRHLDEMIDIGYQEARKKLHLFDRAQLAR